MDISDEEADFLAHYGVKGMHWGIRKDRAPGASRKTNKAAAKDAKEAARAKMFYGEGAGTRRKLINATVEARSKKDPTYRSAFDYHMSKQDMSSHASKARGERSRTDKKKSVRQGAGYVARKITGEWGTTAAFTAVALSGAAFLNSPQGRRFVQNAGTRVSDLMDQGRHSQNARNIRRFLNDQ